MTDAMGSGCSTIELKILFAASAMFDVTVGIAIGACVTDGAALWRELRMSVGSADTRLDTLSRFELIESALLCTLGIREPLVLAIDGTTVGGTSEGTIGEEPTITVVGKIALGSDVRPSAANSESDVAGEMIVDRGPVESTRLDSEIAPVMSCATELKIPGTEFVVNACEGKDVIDGRAVVSRKDKLSEGSWVADGINADVT